MPKSTGMRWQILTSRMSKIIPECLTNYKRKPQTQNRKWEHVNHCWISLSPFSPTQAFPFPFCTKNMQNEKNDSRQTVVFIDWDRHRTASSAGVAQVRHLVSDAMPGTFPPPAVRNDAACQLKQFDILRKAYVVLNVLPKKNAEKHYRKAASG